MEEELSSSKQKVRSPIWELFITWFFDNLRDEIPSLAYEFPTYFPFEMWPIPASPREYILNFATPMIKLFVGKYVEATQGLIDIATITIENSGHLHEPNFENYIKSIMIVFVNLGADPEKALMESWKYLYNLNTLGHPDFDVWETCNISIIFILLLGLIKNRGEGYKEWKKLFDETKGQNTFYLGTMPLQNFIKFVLEECNFDELAIEIYSDMGRDEVYVTEMLKYPNDISKLLEAYHIKDIVKCILGY